VMKAAWDAGVPTAFTLHNYRLICPGSQFLRNGTPCEKCLAGNPYRVLWHRCTPDRSLLKSFLQLRMYLATKSRQFLAPWVGAYIALSAFGRRKFIQGGLPENKVVVKPNSIPDPLDGDSATRPGHGAVFVGRLSAEKGIVSLLKAWQDINYPLTIVGDGPQGEEARRYATSRVRFLGNRSQQEVLQAISKASFLVFPSILYESFGLTLLEAMALGRAVVATDLGPRREIVHDGVTGLLFRADDPQDLCTKVRNLIASPEKLAEMGRQGRRIYLERYTNDRNYKMLMDIYTRVIAAKPASRRAA